MLNFGVVGLSAVSIVSLSLLSLLLISAVAVVVVLSVAPVVFPPPFAMIVVSVAVQGYQSKIVTTIIHTASIYNYGLSIATD